MIVVELIGDGTDGDEERAAQDDSLLSVGQVGFPSEQEERDAVGDEMQDAGDLRDQPAGAEEFEECGGFEDEQRL